MVLSRFVHVLTLPPLPPASAWCNKEARESLSGARGVEIPPSHAEPVRHVSAASHRSEGAWGAVPACGGALTKVTTLKCCYDVKGLLNFHWICIFASYVLVCVDLLWT